MYLIRSRIDTVVDLGHEFKLMPKAFLIPIQTSVEVCLLITAAHHVFLHITGGHKYHSNQGSSAGLLGRCSYLASFAFCRQVLLFGVFVLFCFLPLSLLLSNIIIYIISFRGLSGDPVEIYR